MISNLSLYFYHFYINYHCYRGEDLKIGALVGEDRHGNKYYENDRFFLGKEKEIKSSILKYFTHFTLMVIVRFHVLILTGYWKGDLEFNCFE